VADTVNIIEPMAGEEIKHIVKHALELALDDDSEIIFKFNGVVMSIDSQAIIQQYVDHYHRVLSAGAKIKEY